MTLGTLALSVALAMPASGQLPIIGDPRQSPSPSPTPSEPAPKPSPSPSGGSGGSGGSGSTSKPPKPPKDPSGGSGGSSSSSGSGGSRSSGSSGGSRGSGRASGGSTSSSAPAQDPWRPATVVGPPSGGEGGFGLENWATREKTPARTTTELLELLAQIHGREPTVRELSRGFGRFPILGYAWFQDDYGAPRFIGRVSLHAGVDIFAAKGTPVTATTDGVIWKYARGGRGGNAIWLMGEDGVRYYYGHMDRFAFSPRLGRKLQRGQVIGYVGDTGSAVGTPPHVHFEVNPGGRGTVNPKEHLDAWLDAAINRARAKLETDGAATPLPESNAGWAGILELLNVPSSEPAQLWMVGLDPTSSLALATDAIDELLAGRTWERSDQPYFGATGPEHDDPLGLGLGAFLSHSDAHPHD